MALADQFKTLPPLVGPINPFDPQQRAAVRQIFRAIEGLERENEAAGRDRPDRPDDRPAQPPAAQPPSTEAVDYTPPDPEELRRRLRELFALNSAEILLFAARLFRPDQTFAMPQLHRRWQKWLNQARPGEHISLQTVLSKNRTLGHSCTTRGWRKADLLTPQPRKDPRAPWRFAVLPDVHAAILEVAAERGERTEPAGAAARP